MMRVVIEASDGFCDLRSAPNEHFDFNVPDASGEIHGFRITRATLWAILRAGRLMVPSDR